MAAALSAARLLAVVDDGAAADAARRGRLLVAEALPGGRASAEEELDAMRLGARDAWILELRTATFGDVLPSRVTCPVCEMVLAVDVPRAEVPLSVVEGSDAASDRRVTVRVDDVTVVAEPPSLSVLAAAAACPDVESARERLIEGCVVSSSVSPLPDEVVEQVGAALLEADPATEPRVELACAGCGHEWGAVLDVVLFFWRELSDTAGVLYEDIHELATAYGWSEDQILALPPKRRRNYVERLASA